MLRSVLLVTLIAVLAGAPAAAGTRAAVLGDVALVDQSGAPFHLRELAGRPAAITFVATRCQDTCPIVNAVFARLSQARSRARLVTISLDPAYDTPFVMASFAREMNATLPTWRLVTGPPANVRRVLTAFGVTLERGSDGIPDAHSDFIYVLDHRGRLVKTLPLSTNSIAELRTELARASL